MPPFSKNQCTNHCLLFRGPLMGSNTLWTWILDILTTKYAGCQDRPISVDHSWTKIFCYRSELLTYKLSHSTNSLCMYVYFLGWDGSPISRFTSLVYLDITLKTCQNCMKIPYLTQWGPFFTPKYKACVNSQYFCKIKSNTWSSSLDQIWLL